MLGRPVNISQPPRPFPYWDPEHSYLFIDGGYLSRLYAESVRVISPTAQLDFSRIRNDLGIGKAFYYDCLKIRRPKESEKAFRIKKKEQEAVFSRLAKLPGFHVRKGLLKASIKSPEPRQKMVDVSIAVDMLTHAQSGNLKHAQFIAGDMDFKPLVDALVQLGVWVTLWCGDRADAELVEAADSCQELSIERLGEWSLKNGKALELPWRVSLTINHPNLMEVKRGTLVTSKQTVVLYQDRTDGQHAIGEELTTTAVEMFQFPDEKILTKFHRKLFGSVNWQQPRRPNKRLEPILARVV